MINPTPADIGRRVIYTLSTHRKGYGEIGIITSYNEDVVFVRYGLDIGSKATYHCNLEWAREPGFYRLRDENGKLMIGFLHPMDEPRAWAPNPRERWSVMSLDISLRGPDTTAQYTVVTDLPDERIVDRIPELDNP